MGRPAAGPGAKFNGPGAKSACGRISSMKFINAVGFAGAVTAMAGLAAVGAIAIAPIHKTGAKTPAPLKIGLMDGFSGVYGDLTAGEVEAMQLAIDDVGGKVLGR